MIILGPFHPVDSKQHLLCRFIFYFIFYFIFLIFFLFIIIPLKINLVIAQSGIFFFFIVLMIIIYWVLTYYREEIFGIIFKFQKIYFFIYEEIFESYIFFFLTNI